MTKTQDETICPSCGQRGDADLMMTEHTDSRLPVLLEMCINDDCRVREYYSPVQGEEHE